MFREVKKNFAFFLLLSVALHLTVGQNYCVSSLCPNGKKHIGCKNNGAFSSNCESNARMVPLTKALRQAILNKHNQYRNQIASGSISGFRPAIRMATMQWGNELSKLAALNVKQCVMKHDGCRNTKQFPYSGQNLAVTRWFGKTMTVNEIVMEHIELWFNEYKNTSMKYINNYQNPPPGIKIGHFTQLVQEKATNVGCAILRQERGSYSHQFLACNYAFTNVYNRPVYRHGKAASKCRTGVHKRYRSLCSLKESYNVRSTNY